MENTKKTQRAYVWGGKEIKINGEWYFAGDYLAEIYSLKFLNNMLKPGTKTKIGTIQKTRRAFKRRLATFKTD